MKEEKILAYLGPEGTFSQQAAGVWRDKNDYYKLLPFPTIGEAIYAVADKKAEAAVVPIENSIEGSVNLTLDLLVQEDLVIMGEIVLPVIHNLLGRDKSISPQIVFSHAQALAQCRRYLKNKFPAAKLVATDSTASAALKAAEEKDAFAIGTEFAASLYGLRVLERNIQDYEENKTRFAVIGHKKMSPSGADKTSLVLALPKNKPGGLYRVLKEFAAEEIDLMRIESRPAKAELGEYLFFLDCEGHCLEEPLSSTLERLSSLTVFLKILGSYPADRR